MRRILLTLALALSMNIAADSAPLDPGVHARTFVSAIDGSEQPYNLFVPDAALDGRPVPLVVALHGYGATWETWFQATKVVEWAEYEDYAVLCPHGRGNLYYLSDGERDVFEAMEDAKKHVRIDEDRIYLMGHSMGGWGTWHLASSHPDVWAGIVAMAGWAPTELLGNLFAHEPLVIHGDVDEAVPVKHSRDAVVQLARHGVSHRYIEIKGAGHESGLISDMFPVIGDWLRDRRRPQAPRKIVLGTYTPTRGKAWWLQLVELEFPAHQPFASTTHHRSHVEASWSAEEMLEITTASVRSLAIDPSMPPLAEEAGSSIRIRIDGTELTAEAPSWDGKLLKLHWEERGPRTEQPFKGSITHPVDGSPIWQVTVLAKEGVSSPSSPVIGDVVTPPGEQIAKVAGILRGDSDAYVVLTPTLFLPPLGQGPVTVQDIVDFFPRPEDGISHASIRKDDLRRLLEDHSEWLPAWWEPCVILPEPDFDELPETVSVLLPHIMFQRVPTLPVQSMFRPGIRSQLLHHIAQNGEF